MSKRGRITPVTALIFFSSIFLDQITKAIAAANNVNISIIDNVLEFNYIINTGAAFSSFSGKVPLLTIFSCLAIVMFFVYFYLTPKTKKWLRVSLVFIIAGAAGNLIDRAVSSYYVAQGVIRTAGVRDFIDFPFFANCNIADFYVTIGAIMFIFYYLFLDDECLLKLIKASAAKRAQKQSDDVACGEGAAIDAKKESLTDDKESQVKTVGEGAQIDDAKLPPEK